MEKLKIAIIGQGRSGRDIHGAFFKTEENTFCQVVAVVEADAERRERALREYPGCQVYADYRELYERKDLDLVVNASFSDDHYGVTKDLLEHKFNVVVEKPMARNYFECCQMIRAAEQNGVTLAVFQQSFLAPYYRKVKEILAGDKLGDIKQISIHFSNFSRRWDWQTLQCRMGGGVYNTGPHPLGFALDLLGFDPEAKVAFSKLGLGATSGDAEDYAKIILTAPGKPVVDVEISSIDAFNGPSIKVLGSMGSLKMNPDRSCTIKYLVPGENPEQPLIKEPLKDANGLPTYPSEKLQFHEETVENPRYPWDESARRFYEMVYNKITADIPMTVTPEMAAQIIQIIETAHAQNPLPVWCTKEDPHV